MTGMTKSDSRNARWPIRHPWRAIGLWLAFVATTVSLGGMVETKQAEFSESVLVTPGGPEGRAAVQDAPARLAPLPAVAEVGEPVTSAAGVLELVTVMASTQRRS
jgi:RND superfamily putative drug exporter